MPADRISTRDRLLAHLIHRSDPVIYDIGANHGQSIDRFKAVFPGAHIHSFEPEPQVFSLLEDRHADTPGVSLNHSAVGQVSGPAVFHVNASPDVPTADQTGSLLSLDNDGPYAAHGIREATTVTVPLTTIDDYSRTHGIDRIDFCKIDTQGYSRECLEGAQEMLSNGAIAALQVELLFASYYERVDSFDAIEALLRPHGYYFYTIVNTDTDEIGTFYYEYETGRARHFDVIYLLDGERASRAD